MSIGVFDSGSGGLTVMRALDNAFHDRSFVYWAITRTLLMAANLLTRFMNVRSATWNDVF